MADRGIIFSAPTVRALMDGRKTQTRRLLKVTGVMGGRYPIYPPEEAIELEPGEFARGVWHYSSTAALSGPYRLPAAVGDQLYVRETCRAEELDEGEDGVRYPADDSWRAIANTPEAAVEWVFLNHYGRKRGATVPAIHMPRWASRLILIVSAVKVEPLQSISEADAIAEGVEPAALNDHWRDYGPDPLPLPSPVESYRSLWQSLHDPESWNANPLVVAITFSVAKANIDRMAEVKAA